VCETAPKNFQKKTSSSGLTIGEYVFMLNSSRSSSKIRKV
jgi:hypothetical protein